MPYLNSWRRALVAMALLLSAASGLHAQEASVASGTLRGDVDGDGRVTRADAEAVRAYLVRGTLPAGRSILPAGDANGDGRVTAADAALISRFAAGLDVSRFPVGRPVGEGRGGGEGAPTSSSALQTGDQFCEADVEAGTVTCREVLAGGTAVQNVIVGDPYVSYLTGTAHSRGNPANEDTTIYTVAIKNNTPQPLGTTDGSTLAADGIRLFVTDTPQAVKKIAGSGPSPMTIRLEGSDGRATFTNQDGTVTYTNRMYFQYNQVLAPNATSAVDTLRLIYSANVQKFTFAYRVSAPVQFEHGWITIAPATAPLIGPAQTTTLTASVFNQVGASMADPVTWSSSNPAVATVDGSGVVTGVAGGTVTITAMSSVNGARVGTRIVQVIGANDETFGTTVLGNVAIGSSGFSVIANDSLHGAATIADAGDPVTTAQGGTATVAADGTFTYDPPAGFEGSDSFDYTIESGTASATGTVSLTVAGMIWFVDANAASECTTHCGRKSSPFKALSTFNTANQAGGSNNPADNEPVFLYEGTYTGPVTLRAGQKLIGQDATGALATLAGVTVPTGSTLPSTASGNAEKVTLAGADGINLAQNNAVYGLTLATTAGEAIGGSNFGTLTLAAAAGADVTIASSGQAIGLNTGTLSGGFASVTSTGGTNNVSLVGVGTSGTASLGGGAVSGASGDAFVVTNGTGSFSYSGTVTNTAARAVNVSGKTGGTVAFSGAINPGVVGSAGGVSLTTNTGATIAFSGGMTVSTATSVPFTATGGGTVEVTGTNTLAVTGGATNAVSLSGITVGAGGITFSSVSSSGTTTGSAFVASNVASNGITVGSLTVAGTTGGTSHGIELNSNTAAVSIGGGSVAGTVGDALFISGGSAAVTVNASLAKTSAGRIANIASRTGGAVAVGGSLNCNTSCTGVLANANAGTIDFTSGTKTLATAANAAVTLTSNTGTISFTNGGLAISTTSGAGFTATGGGTVNVTGSLNSVTSTGGGRTVNIQNTNIGASNVTFRSVTGTGAASGVKVENTGTLGGFKITGDGSTASSGGIITLNNLTAADSAAYVLTNTANVSLEFVRVEVTTGLGAGGIAATNLQGTNLIRNSVFDYNQTVPSGSPLHNAYAMYFAQTNTNGTITVDGSSVNGTRSGASAGVLSARGSSVVNFGVIDSNTGDGFQSLFTDLFGSGWVISSGDGGASTAVVNLTVRDSRFTNAAPNGTNNLEMGVLSNATMNFKVKDNLFQNVANSSCICGIVNVNTQDAGVFGANTAMDSIVGNTITNTGTGSAVTDLGYIPMRIAFDNSSATTNRVVIANNVITDSWRQGILLSTRSSSTGNFKVINNTVGTAALPVGQSNRRGIETDLQQSSVMNLEMTGNNVTGAGTVDAAASVGLRVGTDATGSATLNATVVSNTIRSTNGGNNGRFRAESSATSPGTLCLDLRSNNLEDNARLYTLTHSGGTFRVEGAGGGAVTNAAIQAANTAGNGNVSGTVLFNNGANCTQPPI